MIYEKVYNVDINDSNDESDAIDFAKYFVWSECETTEQNIAHTNYIDTVNGVGVHYCYGTGYYFFTDEEE